MYAIPEPEDNPKAALVILYKVTRGIEYDNRGWDKIHFSRCLKAAGSLLDACSTFDIAKKCLEQMGAQFDENELSWTLETVVKHSHDWITKRKGGKDDNKRRERFLGALTDQRSKNALQIKGTLNGGQMLDSIRNLEIIQGEQRSERGNGNIGDGEPREGMG